MNSGSAWDRTADVVVIGYGYAGGMAAIAAHDAGATVLVLERAAMPGGISICSAGGLRIATNVDGAFEYLRETCAGTTPEPVLRTLAEGMSTLPAAIRELASVNGAELGERTAPGNYPFAGHDAFGFVYVERIPGFDPVREYPHVRGSPAGAMLFRVVEDNVRQRAIEVLPRCRVHGLETDARGEVSGVTGTHDGRQIRVRARRAVVLACGGFEADPAMQIQYWPGGSALSAAYRLNTGDGVRMAQAAGADLWHMWHYHGCYGYRHPDPAYPYGIRVKRLPDWCPGEERGLPQMAWILLDGSGRRFMNEYEPYVQDTGARPLAQFDPSIPGFPRLPAWLVVDEPGRRRYPLGKPTFNDPGASFDWSADNLDEVALGIFQRCPELATLAKTLATSPAAVDATLSRWNQLCVQGVDPDFARPPGTLVPIAEPPFYVAPVWPVVSNTQGGPVHDQGQRVLDPYGEPLPRLYAAGELGSVFGHVYLSGGNLAECFIGGRIAGSEAAAERRRPA